MAECIKMYVQQNDRSFRKKKQRKQESCERVKKNELHRLKKRSLENCIHFKSKRVRRQKCKRVIKNHRKREERSMKENGKKNKRFSKK